MPPGRPRALTATERAAGPVQVRQVAGADHNDYALFAGPEVVSAMVAVADGIDAR